MKSLLSLFAFSLVLSSCSAAQKANEKSAADTIASLCKALVPIDAAEELVCATAVTVDEVLQKFEAHEKAIGIVRVAGVLHPLPSGSVEISSPMAPASAAPPAAPASGSVLIPPPASATSAALPAPSSSTPAGKKIGKK